LIPPQFCGAKTNPPETGASLAHFAETPASGFSAAFSGYFTSFRPAVWPKLLFGDICAVEDTGANTALV
jgi:hypothetical protein